MFQSNNEQSHDANSDLNINDLFSNVGRSSDLNINNLFSNVGQSSGPIGELSLGMGIDWDSLYKENQQDHATPAGENVSPYHLEQLDNLTQ
jgi:hypothetical protein